MIKPGRLAATGATARERLLGDKAHRPVAERRATLDALAKRLDRAARQAVTAHLATRVRGNRDFAPVLGTLMRMALDA